MGHFQKYYNICLISYPSILQFFKWLALNLFSSKSKQNTMVGNLWLYEWSMLIFVPWGFSTYFIMPSTISKHTTPIHVISQRVEMTFENDLSVLFIDFGIFGNSPWKNRKKTFMVLMELKQQQMNRILKIWILKLNYLKSMK